LNEAAKLAYRDMTTGRPAQDAVDQFARAFPLATARISGSPDAAASEIRSQIDMWNREMAQSEEALRSGILSRSDNAQLVEAGIELLADMIRSVPRILRRIEGVEEAAAGVDPAQFRK
jgi:hypothetical protein